MKRNRYERFRLEACFGEKGEDFERYADAFKAYQRCESPKTLYGFTEDGDINVIFSKG